VADDGQLDIQIPTPQIGFIETEGGDDDGRTTSAGTDRDGEPRAESSKGDETR